MDVEKNRSEALTMESGDGLVVRDYRTGIVDSGSDSDAQKRRRAVVWMICTVTIVALYCLSGSHESALNFFGTRLGHTNVEGNVNVDAKSSSCRKSTDPYEFNWMEVEPSQELKWTTCYDTFECARFTVPLDYFDSSAGTGAIALIRIPSTTPRNSPRYKGPLLFNPGGPGGSGVLLLRIAGRGVLDAFVGSGYDLIGFDPRGVGFTTPTARSFVSEGEDAHFILSFSETLNHSASSLGHLYEGAHIYGEIAKARTENITKYVGTPAVARDMLEIVKAHGQDKLHYWGFSYGTVLGATFAAMFPDNVGRLVLDGVVDSENYYQGLWSNNLRDTDASLQVLYQLCIDYEKYGKDRCAFVEDTTDKIHARVLALLDKLRTDPIRFYNPDADFSYGIVDYSLVKRIILLTLYVPYGAGMMLFKALADLERGDAQLAWLMSGNAPVHDMAIKPCVCPAPGGQPGYAAEGWDHVFSIACGDAGIVTTDKAQLRKQFEEMAKESIFADCFGVRLACSGWKVETAERFEGSFEVNTSYPILFVGNTADPVTPLWNAHKMSAGFKDSVVLTQDSAGHCSIALPTGCTLGAIRDYFQNGTLPKEGTVCSPGLQAMADGRESLSAEDLELYEAAVKLRDMDLVYRPIMPL